MRASGLDFSEFNPRALRTDILRLLGLKTILYQASGPF